MSQFSISSIVNSFIVNKVVVSIVATTTTLLKSFACMKKKSVKEIKYLVQKTRHVFAFTKRLHTRSRSARDVCSNTKCIFSCNERWQPWKKYKPRSIINATDEFLNLNSIEMMIEARWLGESERNSTNRIHQIGSTKYRIHLTYITCASSYSLFVYFLFSVGLPFSLPRK